MATVLWLSLIHIWDIIHSHSVIEITSELPCVQQRAEHKPTKMSLNLQFLGILQEDQANQSGKLERMHRRTVRMNLEMSKREVIRN